MAMNKLTRCASSLKQAVTSILVSLRFMTPLVQLLLDQILEGNNSVYTCVWWHVH